MVCEIFLFCRQLTPKASSVWSQAVLVGEFVWGGGGRVKAVRNPTQQQVLLEAHGGSGSFPSDACAMQRIETRETGLQQQLH